MMRRVWTVFTKEFIDNLRDRRTLLTAVIMGPLLGPAMIVWLTNVMVDKAVEEISEPLELPVVGEEHAPNLVAFLRENNAEIQSPPADPEKAVADEEVDLVLEIPEDFGRQLRAGGAAPVRLIVNRSNDSARKSIGRAKRLLNGWGEQIGRLRLQARGVNPGVTEAIDIEEDDVSTPEARGALLLGMVPYFIIISMMMGAFNLAIDTTAGERERGSLEPLLTTAATRNQLMAGKLAAAFGFSIVGLLLVLASFRLTLPYMPLARLDMALNFDAGVIAGIAAVQAPFALFGAALLTVVASFTKSFKEAQSYLSMVLLIPVIPVIIMAVNPTPPALWMMVVPSLSQHVLMMELMQGKAVEPMFVLTSVATTLVYGAGLAAIAAWLYRRESVLG